MFYFPPLQISSHTFMAVVVSFASARLRLRLVLTIQLELSQCRAVTSAPTLSGYRFYLLDFSSKTPEGACAPFLSIFIRRDFLFPLTAQAKVKVIHSTHMLKNISWVVKRNIQNESNKC